jgi:hypothetical protein
VVAILLHGMGPRAAYETTYPSGERNPSHHLRFQQAQKPVE